MFFPVIDFFVTSAEQAGIVQLSNSITLSPTFNPAKSAKTFIISISLISGLKSRIQTHLQQSQI